MNRIAKLRKEKNLSMAQVARDLGIPYTTYVNYEKGEREPSSEMLIMLANYFSASVDYIVGRSNDRINDEILDVVSVIDNDILESCNGNLIQAISEQRARNKGEVDLTSKKNVIPFPKMKKVPLLGTIACGEPILAVENIETYINMPENINGTFALRCKGDSMINARIFDGDIVFIREQPDVENGQIAAVLIDDEATLKKVYKYPNRIELRAENPTIKPFEYEGEDMNKVKILGKAVYFLSPVQ